MCQRIDELESAIPALNAEIEVSQKRLNALLQSLASTLENLAREKEAIMSVDQNKTRKPRQFDWLKAHLGWFDKLAPDMSQERWEELLGDGIDRYVASSTSFMEKDVLVDDFSSEKK